MWYALICDLLGQTACICAPCIVVILAKNHWVVLEKKIKEKKKPRNGININTLEDLDAYKSMPIKGEAIVHSID